MPATAEASLADLVEVYLADLATYASASHLRVVTRQLHKIRDGITEPTPVEIIRYRQARIREGLSHRSANMEVGALRACLNWGERMGLIRGHSADRVKALPMTEANRVRRTRPMSDAEREKFLAASRRLDKHRAVPQTPLWRLLLETGIRWGDAVALKPEHVVGNTITIEAATTKGRRSRVIPIPADLLAELRLPVASPDGTPWTTRRYRNACRMFHDTVRAAGFAPMDAAGRTLSIHALRKTAGSTMLRRGANLVEVAAMLGHRDPAMTARLYVEASVDDLSKTMNGKVWGKKSGSFRSHER